MSQADGKLDSKRLTGLDALRGIAAFCIMVFHTKLLDGNGIGPGKAYLAVDFFFVLSGYVMARTYEIRLAGDMHGIQFLLARLRRLAPTMAIGGLIGIPVLYAVSPHHFGEIVIINMLMLPVIYGFYTFPLNVPAWSIFFELISNALHGLFLFKIETNFLHVALVVLALLLFPISQGYSHLDVGSSAQTFLACFPRTLFSYILGIVLWRRWRDHPNVSLPRWICLAIMPLFFTIIWLCDIKTGWIDLSFIFVICPTLIASGLRMEGGQIGFMIGEISFPLYAIHYPLIETLQLISVPWPLQLILSITLAALIAWAPKTGVYRRYVPAKIKNKAA